MSEVTYIYLGDRLTMIGLRGAKCKAVRRKDGKCIRGKNGTMLVDFGHRQDIVIGRLLRKIK